MQRDLCKEAVDVRNWMQLLYLLEYGYLFFGNCTDKKLGLRYSRNPGINLDLRYFVNYNTSKKFGVGPSASEYNAS